MTNYQQALKELTPMNRVHAGPEMQKAYQTLQAFYPDIEIFNFESGRNVRNWISPPGWTVHHAYLISPTGERILDYHRDSILCLYSYSPSFSGKLSKKELEKHLFSNPNYPHKYPYYFRNMYRFAGGLEWGFCIPHDLREKLPEGDYQIEIKTEFLHSPMEMAMQTKAGEHPETLLFVGHFDHPAQCGDGLLGCIAGHEIIERIKNRNTRLTYRMLSTVEIVGSVFYCEERAKSDSVQEVLFTALSGVSAPLIYAQSVSEQSHVDRIMKHLLSHEGEENSITHFRGAAGNDEIAFDVQGVNIPAGSLMRWPYEHYHTSSDTEDKVDDDKFENFISIVINVIDVLEQNSTLKLLQNGLPCLSHPNVNLYLSPPTMSGMPESANPTTKALMESLPNEKAREQAYQSRENFNRMMTLLPAIADGKTTTFDLAERSGVPFSVAHAYTELWVKKGLLEKQWVHSFKK